MALCMGRVITTEHFQEQTFRLNSGYTPLDNLPWDAPGNIKETYHVKI